ncbi:MAG: tungsten ABC transporter substrate-binding protein [Spirochaetes bacterium GWD1_61_31]|nr:MAG: tungsten ABC transporter substrate-binding protein [Spirochaetes bacterium GWB1_60_80]OHD29795.1 MAG: tungsten ABC transporter substrate-binding protein [Spirochaetes bacterium GWC1_61_12]OHD42927.1 MAG: tungsten ABC transporter substrate-binding protein [Spirochaetes bacterium GWE1_60_18]OHD43488.1 MAG: tungsten ABC transporter substrate-binding protein [Spirochaetes bacterium GWD1_61_31]OHD59609.1 MAG: tungsten ABC transporter substrate-binding protein [Spirochaetes bacterium GWF1_60_
MATTTSTDNTGLLDFLLPEFTKDTGYTVDVVAVGTGAALTLGQNADADVLLVHARALEDAFMAAGHGAVRRDVMYNDFVIIGPAADPANIALSANAVEAFRRIQASGAIFVSRGDNSGTHVMEKSLWQRAGVNPAGEWYREAGQGMEQVIIMADNMAAYTLTDRGTWLAVMERSTLGIRYEGDSLLFNPYGVITVNPAKNPAINAAGATTFLEWLTSPRGQQLIAQFMINGKQLFYPSYRE